LPRRTVVLVLLLLCALSFGGWFVRGPVRPNRAHVEPPIDIETPAGRARLDAALALARMPDDPWTFAQSIPAAPAASNAADSKARCGEDQAPVFGGAPDADADGVMRNAPAETRAAGVGYLGAMRRIDAALRASADPFDRSVADALNVGDVLTPTGRLDAMVQDAVTSSDPRIYALAFEACNGSGSAQRLGPAPIEGFASCAQLDIQEWARRDPGNALPWLDALQRADKAGDQAAQREAMQQMASSSRFEAYFGAAPAVVARLQVASDADLYAQSNLAMQATTLYRSPPYQPLTARCRDRAGGDQDRAAGCEAIGEVLFDHSDTMLTRAIGGSIHRLATGDSSRLDLAHQEQRALGEHWTAATGFSPCGAMRQMLKRFVRVGKIGELAAMKEDLRTPTPP
jgi:hypothetical protein